MRIAIATVTAALLAGTALAEEPNRHILRGSTEASPRHFRSTYTTPEKPTPTQRIELISPNSAIVTDIGTLDPNPRWLILPGPPLVEE